ncbi:fimbrial biogenesis chaperone [Peristeroidobacter agariperforans]|uniref:fimbrial biogenesis chaperone n=1 Tax=Peristeroidobacter agariperforans TaxID=268404 RepID=UPI00101CDA30|nr:fimbria/pilus periplasmic chaperone [Peristeroidobacter agariperforans]
MNAMFDRTARRLLGGVLLLAAIGPAFAGSIAVNPIRVNLSATQTTSPLVVRNSGAEPSVVQLQIVTWSQQDGKDVLVPSRDLLATPPIFTVPAGGSQTVRVGLRQRTAAQIEGSYRLILQEVPPPPKPEFRGLQVALRLSVPVFVAPAVAPTTALTWQANVTSTPDSHALRISSVNTGNAHVQVLGFKLFSGGVELPVASPVETAYLLPGQRREWALRLTSAPAAGSDIRIEARTDAGDVQASVAVAGP